MAAKPKLTPEQWGEIRERWEGDPRDGYVWLVAEMGLPVSAPAVRKAALRDGWVKSRGVGVKGQTKPASVDDGAQGRHPRKVSKVSRENHTKVSAAIEETISETIGVAGEDGGEVEMTGVPQRGPGRPTAYKSEYAQQAYRLCLLGATDAELAEFFGVVESTIGLWKLKQPEFSESLKRGKVEADAVVAESLFKRAIGYSHPDVHIAVNQGEVIQTEIVKHYPPDTKAAFIWLKNRKATAWRDKVEVESEVKLGVLDKNSLSELFVAKMQEAHSRQAQIDRMNENGE